MEKVFAYEDLNGGLHSTQEGCVRADDYILSERKRAYKIKTVRDGMTEFVIKYSSGQDKGGYTDFGFIQKLITIFSDDKLIEKIITKLKEGDK